MQNFIKKLPKNLTARIPRTSVFDELMTVSTQTFKFSALQVPFQIIKTIFEQIDLDQSPVSSKIYESLGHVVLNYVNELGPVYGKIMQTFVSRRSGDRAQNSVVDKLKLNRIFDQWPALSLEEVSFILDREKPTWRQEFEISAIPLGVASLGQVHSLVDKRGKEWVVKILKPHAVQRLRESIGAYQNLIAALELVAVSRRFKSSLQEAKKLCAQLLKETSLINEAENIAKATQIVARRRYSVLRIPKIYPEFSTDNILVMERFRGFPLSSVVNGTVQLSPQHKKELAQDLLKEILIQVFELGIFHADPHAGNLMVLKEGGLGLFDWGLTGELLEEDRLLIANILRAMMTSDREKLVDVLWEFCSKNQSKKFLNKLSKKKIDQHLSQVMSKENIASPSKLVSSCLKSIEELEISLPTGLFLMIKTLFTIEGLARGIDSEIKLTNVAAPILWRAANPSFSDVVMMIRKSPKILRKVFTS